MQLKEVVVHVVSPAVVEEPLLHLMVVHVVLLAQYMLPTFCLTLNLRLAYLQAEASTQEQVARPGSGLHWDFGP